MEWPLGVCNVAPGSWNRCPAALGPVLCPITSAVAFINIALVKKGRWHRKITFYYSCSQGAMLSLSQPQNPCCFSSFTAKYLCYKCPCLRSNIWAIITKVFQRYLEMLYVAQHFRLWERISHSRKHWNILYISFTLIHSISFLTSLPPLSFFFWQGYCMPLLFISLHFQGMNCSPLSLGFGQEFIFSRSIVSECHLWQGPTSTTNTKKATACWFYSSFSSSITA